MDMTHRTHDVFVGRHVERPNRRFVHTTMWRSHFRDFDPGEGCLQFWGSIGYTWENRVSRKFRDGRLASIGGGADEVMLGILANTMGIAMRLPKA